MNFRISILPPSPALAGDVMGYIVRRRTAGGAGGNATPPSTRFPANMYAALTLVHSGRLVDPSDGTVPPAISFSGAMTRDAARTYVDHPETTVVLFKPGRLTDVLRLPAGELTDRWVDAGALLRPHEHTELVDRVASQRTVARQVHVIETLLERRLRHAQTSRAAILARMVQQLVWRLPHMTVRDLAEHASIGERQLHRHFLNTFGLRPKALIRLARLQLSLWHVQQAARRAPRPLAEVAHAAGFADQSHMANDFKALVGQSPATLRDRMQGSLATEWAYELPQDLLHPRDDE